MKSFYTAFDFNGVSLSIEADIREGQVTDMEVTVGGMDFWIDNIALFDGKDYLPLEMVLEDYVLEQAENEAQEAKDQEAIDDYIGRHI